MGKEYQLVVFDWEGTLGDTLGQILQCVAEEAQRMQLGELDEKEARRYVHLGLEKACQKLFPNLTKETSRELQNAVQRTLGQQYQGAFLFKGARVLIEKLAAREITLAIATNKGQQSLQRALESTGLDAYFKCKRSAGQVPPKPCPQMLEEILVDTGIPVEKALMIGDSESDIIMARSIKMDVIAVNFYQQDPGELLAQGALAVFDDYQLVAEFLDCG